MRVTSLLHTVTNTIPYAVSIQNEVNSICYLLSNYKKQLLFPHAYQGGVLILMLFFLLVVGHNRIQLSRQKR